MLVILAAAALASVDPAPQTEVAKPAAAAPAPAAPAPAPPVQKAKGSDLVCWQEAPTGSHYPKRVCATRDQLEFRERNDREAITQHSRVRVPGLFGK